ncbi:acetyltransferase (GNAT) family protein [Enterobacter sp. AG5470]|nr:acetyltransferase (GNAT) family protein [Enterobacter sp. AG5470]
MTTIKLNDKYAVNVVDTYAENNLFTSKRFIEHQIAVQNKEVQTFALVESETGKQLAIKSFARARGASVWTSPVTGAFGPMQASSFISMGELEFFISTISEYLLTQDKSEKIVWRLPPQYYQNKVHTKVQNVLFRQKWVLDEHDLNFHLPITTYEDFRDNLSSSKRRELNRITKSKPVFSEATTAELRREVYDVIKLNRESQGFPMTMSWEAIDALSQAVNEKIKFYILTRDNITLAGAICLNLDEDVLYVFYWGEHPDYRKDSTIVKLAEGIYLAAAEDGFNTLDIGTSTDHSMPNQGLINFKENIGCLVSQKITVSFSKDGK